VSGYCVDSKTTTTTTVNTAINTTTVGCRHVTVKWKL